MEQSRHYPIILGCSLLIKTAPPQFASNGFLLLIVTEVVTAKLTDISDF